jgi:hypothetical protein
MYSLIRQIPIGKWAPVEIPAFVISFVIAEIFYKFHSFSLECLAFVVTWIAFGFAFSHINNLLGREPRIETK